MNRRRSLKALALGSGASLVPGSMFAATVGPHSDGLARTNPAEANIDPRIVLNFIDSVFAHDLDLHSFMLYRHGHVVAEGWSWPYASHRPHIMHSLTKSVTACGVGVAVDEGRFALSDRVVSFFSGEVSEPLDAKLSTMTVRDLLTMQSGHAISVSGSVFRPIKTSWVTEFFKIPVVHKPGTHFIYSSAVSFMLSAIVSQTTGQSVRDYLQSRLFEPMGIQGITWGASPNGVSSGGNGLTWKTQDSLKLGVLHLQRGRWRGEQLLSSGWVDEATKLQVPGHNYGYQWWVNESAPAYMAIGAFGQYTIVFPEHDAVLAITAGVPNDAGLDRIIFEHFPVAFRDASFVPSAREVTALTRRTEHLRLVPQARATRSQTARRIDGKAFQIDANDDNVTRVQLDFGDREAVFRQWDHRGEHAVRVGLSDWIESDTGITGNKLHHQYQSDAMRVVAHGRWWDEHTFEMTWQFVETAWADRVVCRFLDNRISVDRRTNANYADTVAPTLRGEIVDED